MQRLSDQFARAAEACSEVARLRDLLTAVTRELGFSHFALLDHQSLCAPPDGRAGLVRIDNYPEEWSEEIRTNNHGLEDPVHLASGRARCGFEWSALGALITLEQRHRTILERGRFHGIGSGFTIPSNLPGEPAASCSFALAPGRAMPRARLDCAELIGGHALRAARRLRTAWVVQRPRLSRRELQCLRLVALGKTDWEIAAILGLSIETAHQYVKRARAAYGSVSRTQLVVHALRDQWISFEEAIPPNG